MSKFPIQISVVGQSQRFLNSAKIIGQKLPALFRQVDKFGLSVAYKGCTLRIVENRESGLDGWSYNQQKDELSIYPDTSNGRQFERAILTGFGFRFFTKNLGATSKTLWRRKLVKPNKNVVDKLQELLRTKTKNKLSDYVQEFDTATDRLTAIHLINALIKNNISASRARTIDLKTFPGTAAFAKGNRPYSLIPLLSVYSGKYYGLDKYENAFAEYCLTDGKFSIAEKSTALAAKDLFRLATFGE
jgi:hypothetical protein